MSGFHMSAELESIRIDGGNILKARVRRQNGEMQESELDLDCCIGNINGHFQWGAGGFSLSAEEIRVSIEHGEPILRASLRTESGAMESRDLNLSERIANLDGRLCFE